MLVFLVAGGLLVVGLLDTGLYLAKCFQPKAPAPVRIFPLTLDALPGLAGVVILFKVRTIAEWLANKFD
jgi:hypothetical protein